MEGLLIFIACAATICAPFVIANRLADRRHRDGHWHAHRDRSRRWIKGQWQYREMTRAEAEEITETISRRAW